MIQSFRQKLKARQPLIGTIQTLSSVEVTEIVCLAGFDWLFIDMEHSPLDPGAVQRILQVCGDQCPGIVRLPADDEVWVKRALDIGAAGLIFPQVNTQEQAQRIIQLVKYPPAGTRGVGLARAQGYGMRFKEYIDSANQDIGVILQIEHIDAVKNIESIVKVPDIDALFIGPYDLSASMGRIGQVNDPAVQQQIEHVRSVCLDAGLAPGIFTANPQEVKTFIEKGYTLITLGIDTMILGKALKQTLQEIYHNITAE